MADRYRLLAVLGRGGMGTVWRGLDERLGRTVALKQIHPPDSLATAEISMLRLRMEREAQAMARIRHPGVVTVYDVVNHDDDPWIVMEYVPARSLDHVVRDAGPMEPDRAATMGLEILEALDAIHRCGILHRDVKPSNVLITADGRAVLTDFGIATFEGAHTLTRAGEFMGSPAYLAPEIAQGRQASVGSDLWSFGATLYYALEGQAPYARESFIATLAALLTKPPRPPARAGDLTALVTGLLQREPNRRLNADKARVLLKDAQRRTAKSAAASTPTASGASSPRAGAPAERGLSEDEFFKRAMRRGLLIAAVVVVAVVTTFFFLQDHRPSPRAEARKTPTGSPTPSATRSARVPTLTIRCDLSRCPVFVREPGGEVLIDRDLSKNESRSFFSKELDVVLDDAGAVTVIENGKRRELAHHHGERQAFSVRRTVP
ncbi:hypothetical protein Mame01_17140 [Microbispora amethystogenes]|nr:hypothetical protein Mame01_17140 [Microbispora amethystogenes]